MEVQGANNYLENHFLQGFITYKCGGSVEVQSLFRLEVMNIAPRGRAQSAASRSLWRERSKVRGAK